MKFTGARLAGLGCTLAALIAGSVVVATASGPSAHAVPRGYEIPAPQPSPVIHPASRPDPRPATRPVSAATAAAPTPAFIATLAAPTTYYATPGGAPAGSLAATNPFGSAQVLAVIGALDTPGWLHVELPVRPNGSTGWIPSSGVQLTETYYRVAVSLARRTLTVTDYGKLVLSVPAAIGAPSTPTPSDSTYLWELVRPDDPTGDYGPYIFGLAEFSDTYAVFNGGDAQIGIHGQNDPASVGQPVSHGCVRLANPVITDLAGFLPLGTPVTIS